ncbi:MAG: FAD-dependent oxidoreductase [Acidimicrobiia bacterium]|nr:FAD-dependent oxidoreductase [Acidimicrobiia bacterium]
MEHIVVVGASLAGLRAVEAFRREGFAGRLTFVGAEPDEPYDRPPLSKAYLAGDADRSSLALRAQGYDELDVDLRLGQSAHSLDVSGRTVGVGDESVAFDGLVIATGAAPRRLPTQPDVAGVHTLRTIADSDAIGAWIEGDARLCVIGAGFIGAEVAATARSRNRAVTVLEALPQPMVRGVGPVIGEVLARLHRARGVDLRLGVGVDAIAGDSTVERVHLVDGSVVECDAVLVAIGAVPTTDWLEGSGLTVDNGVVCDASLHAAPGIVAAGDVCRWPNEQFDGEVMRIEHWTNAAEQGTHAARSLLAGDDAAPFATVPFVWSDQYDVKIQSAGRFSGEDRMEIVSGSVEEDRFVAIFERGGRISGVLGFSQPRRVIQYRRMIADHESFDAALAFAAENP